MIKTCDIEKLNRITCSQLEDFCTYWNSNDSRDGGRIKYANPESYSNYPNSYYRKYPLLNQWTVYEYYYDDYVLLGDENGNIRLKGNTEEIIGLLLNLALTNLASNKIAGKEYGLVLSGGGAKGAFEIGVWRWLEKTGLIHKISGISGTSVGAMNSILLSCTTLEEAENIWCSIQQDDFTHIDAESLDRAANTVKRIVENIAFQSMDANTIPLIIKDLLLLSKNSVITQEKLAEIIDLVLSNSFTDRIVFSCVARASLQIQNEPPAESSLGAVHNADYYCLNGRTNEEIRKCVLASAAIPIIYDPVTINHFQYRDGFCRDNTPYMPLVKLGFKKLIVIHLSENNDKNPAFEMKGSSLLFHVYPTIHEKKYIDSIRISEETTRNWIENGEQAASSQLGFFLKNGELALPDNIEDGKDEGTNMEKFDYENFNYDEAFNKMQEEIRKPNILICGTTGAGKSTLIKNIFQFGEFEGPVIGNEGRPKTIGVHRYSPEDATITLYDSQGYDIGVDESKFKKEVIDEIGRLFESGHENMDQHIHEVWYCVSAATNRFFSADEKMIREIQRKYSTPVMIILTKVDCTDDEGIYALKNVIKDKFPDISVYSYAADEKTENWDEETKKQYVQKDEIIDWALEHLDESLRSSFIPAIKKSLERKRNDISKRIIPKYSLLAAGTVAATSFINVPFSDSIPLMGYQVKMALDIIRGYGIKVQSQKIAADLIGTSAISILGKTLAGNLIKVIPIAGNVISATVNTSVAASVTSVLGFAVAVVCEKYLEACVDNNGASNLPFAQYINNDVLKEAINYVNNHKDEFNIQEILNSVATDIENKMKSGI